MGLSTWVRPVASQRVTPLQSGEPREIAVGGTEFGAVFDRQRSQMCVRRQIPSCAKRLDQLSKHGQVARTGMDDRHRRLTQPGVNKIKGCMDKQRTAE